MTQRWTDEMLDKLAERTDQNTESIDRLSAKIDKILNKIEKNPSKKPLEFTDQNIKFTVDHQFTKLLVQLAFVLMAFSTLTVIITSVF